MLDCQIMHYSFHSSGMCLAGEASWSQAFSRWGAAVTLHTASTDISTLTFLYKGNRCFFIWWVNNYFWTQISGNIFMASHSPKWILPFSSTKACELLSIGWNSEFKVQERKWDLSDIITLNPAITPPILQLQENSNCLSLLDSKTGTKWVFSGSN